MMIQDGQPLTNKRFFDQMFERTWSLSKLVIQNRFILYIKRLTIFSTNFVQFSIINVELGRHVVLGN